MSVIELALLRLVSINTATSPPLLAHLKTAKDAMESFSGFLFSYYHCLEDPSLIFIVGGWPSAKFHWEEWIPSSQNQELLTVLKDEVEVEYMFHVDLDRKSLENVESQEIVAIGRHTIKPDGRAAFDKTFGEVKSSLETGIGGSEKVRGGWRVEKGFLKGEELVTDGMGGEEDEWVLFTGWESRDAHMAFAKTQEFEEYGKTRACVERFDIKHGVKMDV